VTYRADRGDSQQKDSRRSSQLHDSDNNGIEKNETKCGLLQVERGSTLQASGAGYSVVQKNSKAKYLESHWLSCIKFPNASTRCILKSLMLPLGKLAGGQSMT
jgi:hypothetical protein